MEDDSVPAVKQFYNVSDSGNSSSKRKIKFSRIFLAIIILLVVAGTTYAIVQSVTGNKTPIAKPTTQPTSTPFPTQPPTPTPTPEISTTPSPSEKITPTKISTSVTPPLTPAKGKLSIEILNGSGIAGAGKKAADLLRGLGYTVVSTGNADTFDYEETVIQVKSSKSASLTQLKKDVSSSYTVGSTTSDLPSSAAADARIIIGKQ